MRDFEKFCVYNFYIFIFLVGCQSTQNDEIFRFDSNCREISQEYRVKFNSNNPPTFRKTPSYPTSAAMNKLEGYVKFEFDISKTGNPINIHVIESYPSDTFVGVA